MTATRETQIILGLDVDSKAEALAAVDACDACSWFKIGLQLFSRCGPPVVAEIQALGKQVFLDLKLHDIPNTVTKAARAAADLGVDLITVHAAGGIGMIEAARKAVEPSGTRVLAVTVLTSISDRVLREEIGIPETAAVAVPRLARMAVSAGAHGVVASPQETKIIRQIIGSEALIVTPGVRPAWAGKDDQARVMTPKEAADAGADFLVISRPILAHANPAEAYRLIREEIHS